MALTNYLYDEEREHKRGVDEWKLIYSAKPTKELGCFRWALVPKSRNSDIPLFTR